MTIEQDRPTTRARSRSPLRFLAAGGILVGGVVAYLIVLFVMVDTQNVNFFPSLLLVGAVTVPMSVLVVANQAGSSSRVPTWAIVFTAIVGGVIGVVAAGLLEYDTLRRLGSVPMLFIGLIEEAAKLIVPVILYLLARLGILSYAFLSRRRRWAILLITLFAIVITPGDIVVGSFTLAVVMYGLFEITLQLIRLMDR